MSSSRRKIVLPLLAMTLAMGCLEFWHKDVGIVPTAVKQDQRAQMQELSRDQCPPGQRRSAEPKCTKTSSGVENCRYICVEKK